MCKNKIDMLNRRSFKNFLLIPQTIISSHPKVSALAVDNLIERTHIPTSSITSDIISDITSDIISDITSDTTSDIISDTISDIISDIFDC